ncbi:hypothetical protein A9K55_004568 [Cordyceps militaris]|uniref:Uncharacterized protein n=1 Tax=Cordyceps militaris TaxID=73501 RepID=A0A2H4SM96_CORMI|nr:hypothetical protein A9K55_004568 [Cordyceps militaris]
MSAFEAPSRTPPPLQTPPPPDKPKNRGSSTAAFVVLVEFLGPRSTVRDSWSGGKNSLAKFHVHRLGDGGEGRLLSTDTKSSGRGGPDCANAPQHGASTASHPSSEVDKQPDSTQALEKKKKSRKKSVRHAPPAQHHFPHHLPPLGLPPLLSPSALRRASWLRARGFSGEISQGPSPLGQQRGKGLLLRRASVSFQAAGFLTLSPNGARAEQALSCWADWPPFQHDCGLTGPDIKFATISAEYGGTTSKQERAKKNRTWWEMQGLDRSSARGHRRQDMLLVAVLARLHRGRPNSFAFC